MLLGLTFLPSSTLMEIGRNAVLPMTLWRFLLILALMSNVPQRALWSGCLKSSGRKFGENMSDGPENGV